jgi:hypothetical protein
MVFRFRDCASLAPPAGRDGVITDIKAQDFAVAGFSSHIAEDPGCIGASVIEIHHEFGTSASACRDSRQLKQLGGNTRAVAVERACQRYFGAIPILGERMNFQDSVQEVRTASRDDDSALPMDRPAVRDDGLIGLSAAETTPSIVEVEAEIESLKTVRVMGCQELKRPAIAARSGQMGRFDCIIHVATSMAGR